MKVRKFLTNDGLEAVNWGIETYSSILTNNQKKVFGFLELSDGHGTISFDTDQMKGLMVLIEEINRFNQEYLKTLGLIKSKKAKPETAKKPAKKKAK